MRHIRKQSRVKAAERVSWIGPVTRAVISYKTTELAPKLPIIVLAKALKLKIRIYKRVFDHVLV